MIWFFPYHRDLWLALLGGLPVALIGWFDDRHHISARVRLWVHLLSALWATAWLGYLEALELGFTQLPLGLFGALFTVIGIVWAINLYNFMDGIDGLAGGQALVTAFVAGWFFIGGAPAVALACWILAAAVGGFLCWNWSPAKIFMGDVGSGTLGFIFAVLALFGERSNTLPLLAWLLLLCPFIADATFTLLRRSWQGERWYLGHRTHAYQLAVQRGYSHAQVTSSILLLDLVLVAWVAFGIRHPLLLLLGLLWALFLLFCLWQALTKRHLELAKVR